MGSEISKVRMQQPLRELLKANGTPLKIKTVSLDTIEKVAPWFLDEGNIPQWEHLGEDLHRADRQDPLPVGTMAIWSLVRGCLDTNKDKFVEPLTEGSQVLEEIKALERASIRSETDKENETGCEDSSDEEEDLLCRLKKRWGKHTPHMVTLHSQLLEPAQPSVACPSKEYNIVAPVPTNTGR